METTTTPAPSGVRLPPLTHVQLAMLDRIEGGAAEILRIATELQTAVYATELLLIDTSPLHRITAAARAQLLLIDYARRTR